MFAVTLTGATQLKGFLIMAVPLTEDDCTNTYAEVTPGNPAGFWEVKFPIDAEIGKQICNNYGVSNCVTE